MRHTPHFDGAPHICGQLIRPLPLICQLSVWSVYSSQPNCHGEHVKSKSPDIHRSWSGSDLQTLQLASNALTTRLSHTRKQNESTNMTKKFERVKCKIHIWL